MAKQDVPSICRTCKSPTPLHLLDSKPDHRFHTFREMAADFGQVHALEVAADRGWPFDRLECKACYGDGWEAGPEPEPEPEPGNLPIVYCDGGCRCFFQGRTFYPDPDCEDHGEDEDEDEE